MTDPFKQMKDDMKAASDFGEQQRQDADFSRRLTSYPAKELLSPAQIEAIAEAVANKVIDRIGTILQEFSKTPSDQ